jgi:hypothetical protein
MIPEPQDELCARMGVDAREPVGAVLRVGRKDPRTGNPTDNDKFFVVSPQTTQREYAKKSGEAYRAPHRELHTDFRSYNEATGTQRTVFRGVLVGTGRAQCFRVRYATNKPLGAPYPAHPDFRPSCSSDDAITARRLYYVTANGKLPSSVRRVTDGVPEDETWGELSCPAESCPFRGGDTPRCAVQSWLYFMPRWVGKGTGGYMPESLMRFHTSSGNTTGHILGFFQQTDAWARDMGLESYSLIGLPFTLSLAMVHSRKRGRAFPIVSMAHDGQLAEFFAAQRRTLELAGGRVVDPTKLLTADMETSETLAEDAAEIGVQRIPGGVAEQVAEQSLDDVAVDDMDEARAMASEVGAIDTAIELGAWIEENAARVDALTMPDASAMVADAMERRQTELA